MRLLLESNMRATKREPGEVGISASNRPFRGRMGSMTPRRTSRVLRSWLPVLSAMSSLGWESTRCLKISPAWTLGTALAWHIPLRMSFLVLFSSSAHLSTESSLQRRPKTGLLPRFSPGSLRRSAARSYSVMLITSTLMLSIPAS